MPLFGPPDIPNLKQNRNIKGLIKALNYQKDKNICAKAAEALGLLKAVEAIPALIQRLKEKNLLVAKAAQDALNKMSKDAVEPLINALPDPDLRWRAVQLLGEAGDQRAVVELLPLLEDPDRSVQVAAAVALGQIGDPQSGAHLAKVLSSPDFYLRRSSAAALKALKWEPPTETDKARFLVAMQRWHDLVSLGKTAVPALVSILDSNDRFIISQAVKTLGRIGVSEAVPVLIQLLDKDQAEIQKDTADALGRIGDAQAVAPLIEHFPQSEPIVSSAILKALGRIGGKKAMAFLIDCLINTQNQHYRIQAARSLTMIKNPDPQALQELVSYANMAIVEEVLLSIGKPALPVLSSALQTSQTNEPPQYIIRILGESMDPQAVSVLVPYMEHPHWSTRMSAARALVKLGWHPKSENAKILVEIAQEKWTGVRLHQDSATQLMIEYLDQDHLRIGAIDTLGEIGGGQVMEILLTFLQNQDWETRKAAGRALVRIYQRGMLVPKQNQILLDHRMAITCSHTDTFQQFNSTSCGEPHEDHTTHTDQGIGVDFPL